MNIAEKIELLTDMLETEEEIDVNTQLDDLDEWDSLAVLSFMALAKKQFNKKISPDEIKTYVTIGDLCEALN